MTASLLVSIVPHDEGERISSILKKAGAMGGTILMGRGTAENAFLLLLGIGDTSKDIVFTLTEADKKSRLLEALKNEAAHFKPHYGICFSLDAERDFSAAPDQGRPTTEENQMTEKTHRLVTAILNKGFADDAMAAARKAGAGGGTIIHARGTAKEEDVSFLGITLVPEKEMLMILVEKGKADAVLGAIRTLPCLAEPGSGIVYCMDVDSFTGLGRAAGEK